MVVERRNRVLKRCRFGRLIRVQAFDANRALVCRSQSIELFSRPAVHTAISGLMAEMPSAPGLSARLLSRFQDKSYVLLQQFLDMISGTVMMPLANEWNLDDAWVDQTTALIVRGIAR
jgi:hypothetical protein